MTKKSIEDIVGHLVDVKESLSNFIERQKKQRGLNEIVYEESTVNDYIQDINIIIDQLEYLTRSSRIFCQISTLQERRNITSGLSILVSYLDRDDFVNIEGIINSIKPNLRGYYIFLKKEFAGDLQQIIIDLEEVKVNSQDTLNEVEKILEKSKDEQVEFFNLFNELKTRGDDINKMLTTAAEFSANFGEMLSSATEKENNISNILNSVKSHEGVIDSFSKRVENREAQLEKQDIKTNEYTKKLSEYTTEHLMKLDEAQKLIRSARDAMKYKTAEGISAAIQLQYMEAKSGWNTIPWLVGSMIFVLATMLLGGMIVFGDSFGLTKNTDHWSLMLGRVALLPILITAVIFTANRYIKQKNIIEDYAYKMVLAKSIVGFSDELLKAKETNNGYQEFIKQILSQILQDPLRNRNEKSDESVIIDKAKDILSNVADIAGKFLPNKP